MHKSIRHTIKYSLDHLTISQFNLSANYNMDFKTSFRRSLIIAVDFDGTIVEHRYPSIGRIRPLAFETLSKLQSKGHRLILWSHRAGQKLDDAVAFCLSNGIDFYAVNKNFPEEIWNENDSRKILADIYIDDRNLGRLPSWGEIFNMICPEEEIPSDKEVKFWWKRK